MIFRAKQTIKKTTRGEVIISGTISDEEFIADSDATEEEMSADESEDVPIERIESSPKPINQRQNTEQKFKIVLKLWTDFITSANDLLREIPKGSYEVWNKQISAKGKVKCPLKVFLSHNSLL